MIWLYAIITYSIAVTCSYLPAIKNSNYYYLAAATLGVLTNLGWFWLAKNSGSNNQIMLNGLYWDGIIVGCYVFIPIMFFGISMSLTKAIGVAVIIIGVFLTKV